jgi:hypothetical protein
VLNPVDDEDDSNFAQVEIPKNVLFLFNVGYELTIALIFENFCQAKHPSSNSTGTDKRGEDPGTPTKARRSLVRGDENGRNSQKSDLP